MSDITNRSPWLHQLKRTRPLTPLPTQHTCDVVVVGAGIAGVMTTYFVLKNTEKTVALVERDRVAHGATGHNAGQVVAEFEEWYATMAQTWGRTQTAQAWKDVHSAWDLLQDIQDDLNLQTPLYRTQGMGGFSDIQQIKRQLKDIRMRQEDGVHTAKLVVVEEFRPMAHSLSADEDLFSWTPQEELLRMLNTRDKHYIAGVIDDRACMNSAMLCEEMVEAMLMRWKGRLNVFEESHIQQLVIGEHQAQARGIEGQELTATTVVLCTNGFENITLTNQYGIDINARFHHDIEGKIGYMGAYYESVPGQPMANYYLSKPGTDPEQPYFYVTRRPYDLGDSNETTSLVSVGGPERDLPEDMRYHPSLPYAQHAHDEIDTFIRSVYRSSDGSTPKEAFFWHGLMGYTATRIRLIGPEPCNNTLMYNLGCNGIGILPSIYGGYKISQFVAGQTLEPSIFDPRDQRCAF